MNFWLSFGGLQLKDCPFPPTVRPLPRHISQQWVSQFSYCACVLDTDQWNSHVELPNTRILIRNKTHFWSSLSRQSSILFFCAYNIGELIPHQLKQPHIMILIPQASSELGMTGASQNANLDSSDHMTLLHSSTVQLRCFLSFLCSASPCVGLLHFTSLHFTVKDGKTITY